MSDDEIRALIELASWVLAIGGLVLWVGWFFELIAVVWRSELTTLRKRCRSFDRENVSLRRENTGLRSELRHLRKVCAIDNVAQRTTRAMLQVAAEEVRRADRRAIDRR